MRKIVLHYPPGATPLDPNELNGLIPTYITTQEELNQLEKENILTATQWALGKSNHDCLNISFCLQLHKRMFSRVWKWAGAIRQSDKNIGVPKEQIYLNLKLLFEDTDYWIREKTFDFDEVGARFHHRLVSIHSFSNGNGRHARLLTEVIQIAHGEKPFTWGSLDLYSPDSKIRADYIEALKAADNGSFYEILQFIRR